MTGAMWAIIAGVGLGLFQSINRWVVLGMDVSQATFPLTATNPLFAAVIAALTLREFPTLLTWVGILLIISGVSCIATGADHAGGGGQGAPPRKWRAMVFGLSAACCWAISPIFTRQGLLGLPSPLLGVTVGLTASVLALRPGPALPAQVIRHRHDPA